MLLNEWNVHSVRAATQLTENCLSVNLWLHSRLSLLQSKCVDDQILEHRNHVNMKKQSSEMYACARKKGNVPGSLFGDTAHPFLPPLQMFGLATSVSNRPLFSVWRLFNCIVRIVCHSVWLWHQCHLGRRSIRHHGIWTTGLYLLPVSLKQSLKWSETFTEIHLIDLYGSRPFQNNL